MHLLRYFGLFVLAIALPAQQQQERPASVRGQVVSITGEPLRKADVTLTSTGATSNSIVATTDASGAFAFENLPASRYYITAQRNGYVPQQSGTRFATPVHSLTVAPSQNVTGVIIKLTPHSVITGKVTDEDGDPMPGASVSVLEERYNRGRRTLAPRSSGMVNDLGEYRIAGLQPGKYFLSVNPRGEHGPANRRGRTGQKESNQSFVTVFYPGVTQVSQASPLTLAAGQEARGIDLQMRKMPTVHVRGQVVDEAGNPIANTMVMLLNADGPGGSATGRNMGAPQRDGAFDIAGVSPGNYTLMANRMSREQGRSSVYMSIQVGTGDVDGLVLRTAPAAQVTGVVNVADNPDLKAMRVVLDPMDNQPFDMLSSHTFAEGNAFIVAGVAPGRYRVDVFGAPQGYFLQSVRIGGQEVMDSGLAVSGSVSALELTLVKGAVNATGSVTDAEGKPVAQALVALVPPEGKRDQWRLFKTALADQNGQYSFRNLTPGEYKLFAFTAGQGDYASLQNPDFLTPIEAKGTTVKLGENSTEPVALKVIE